MNLKLFLKALPPHSITLPFRGAEAFPGRLVLSIVDRWWYDFTECNHKWGALTYGLPLGNYDLRDIAYDTVNI